MPEYLHPGVYIEEQPAAQTIEGVSTSTAGFVGATAKGPTSGLPKLVTSFPDFTRTYGSYLPEEGWGATRYLAYAVAGFFNNGGQRVYIKRVVGSGASAASLTLNDGFVTRLLEDTASEPAARDTVRLASLRGISEGSQLTFSETIGGTEQAQTQTVAAYNNTTNSVTLDAPLVPRYTAAGCRVSLDGVTDAPLPASGIARLTVAASSEGLWGRSIQVTATDVDGAVGLVATGVETTLTAALAISADTPMVSVANTAGFAAGDLARLDDGNNSQLVRISSVNGPQEVTLNTSPPFAIANAYAADDTRFILATAGNETSNRLNLRSTRNFYPQAVIEIDDGTTKTYHTVASIDGQALVLSSVSGRDVLENTVVRVVEFGLLFDDGTTSELFENLSMDAAAPNFVQNVVNLRSRLVQVTVQASARPAPFNLPRTLGGAAANLAGGDNGAPPNADDYRGTDNGPGQRTGIKALADIDDISIIAAPGASDASVQAELIGQCEQLKDRFAVLDPAMGSVMGSGSSDDVIVQRNNHDTFYAAIYYPWLRIRDPLYPDEPNGRLVPPSGHAIGIYARVDAERGVQKAPANEVVRGITGLEVKLSDREQDILNPKNINVIRDFRQNGRGIRVWGSRCLTSDNAWKYVPVRRLFIFMEESLYEGLQWVVFEPNGENLWARVRRTITGFLRTLWLSGALAGVTEEEAFFVRCDRSTMTEDDIANGRLIVLVGAAPLRPAEFVIVRVSQKTLEAST